MKIKNSQIILIIATMLGVYLLLAGYLSLLDSNETKTEEIIQRGEVSLDTKNKEENKTVEGVTKTRLQPQLNRTHQIELKALSGEEIVNIKNIKVSLSVLDKNYELEVKDNSSVFEMMKELEISKESEFSFNYKEYPSLGIFVYEINGMKEKRGSYWIYYVNDKEASVGVSNYTLKEGDSILWKQE